MITSVNDIIKSLKANNSILVKKQIISDNKDHGTFLNVLYLSLDPSIVFDVKKLPDYIPAEIPTKTLYQALEKIKDVYTRKVTGHRALHFIKSLLEELNKDDAEVLCKVILKDLDCGVQEKIVNAVIPGHIKDEPYMRCSLIDSKTAKNITSFETHGYAVSEVKMDGQYLNCAVVEDTSLFTSRNGKVYDFQECLDADLTDIAESIKSSDPRFSSGVVFMGEGTVVDDDGNILPRETGNGIIQKAGKGTMSYREACDVRFIVWDVVPLDAYMERIWNVERKERREIIESAISATQSTKVRMVKYKKVLDIKEAFEYNAEEMENGEEGTILKCESGIWKSHTSPKQLKMKLKMQFDLRIVGFNEGKKKRAGMLGSIMLESEDGIITVNCGSGIKEKDHEWTFKSIWERKDELLGKILTVESNELTIDKRTKRRKVFLPIFIEFRFDKDTCDDYERILEIRASAIEVLMQTMLVNIANSPKSKKK